jgi:hypothetical protein
MERLCEQLRASLHGVVRSWNEMMRGTPLDSVKGTERLDNVPDLVLGMVEASLCNPADRASHEEKVAAAVKHGEVRREQGFSEELLFEEYDALRKAFWRTIRAIEDDAERCTMGILRIDLAMTLATHASMRGFFRKEIEATGDWDQEIRELADSSPFLRGFD